MQEKENSLKEEQNLEEEEKEEQVVTENEKIDEEEKEQDCANLELEKYKKEAEILKDVAQRAQADFINYKRRTEKQMQDISALANEKILTELLSVLDNFQRALDAVDDKENDHYKGVEMIKNQLFDVMKKSGLEEINALGEDFDPNMHHAVMQEQTEGEPNKVIEELQKGYKLKDKVIRASMVKVSC